MTTSHRGPRRYRGLVFICTFLIAAVLPCGAAVAAGDPGSVKLARGAESNFDSYTAAPSLDQQAWMRNSYWRMRTYAPYFNARTSWFPSAWAYQDAYAIYPGSPEASQHPDWILKDANGNKLWIQFGCSNGSCTQYAADIGNPDFRAWWIQNAQARLAAGYKGLFIDDVNMAQRVSNGNGVYTMPIDPRTGQAMNETQWDKYMADFMVQVRAALPGAEIVHNTIWTMGDATSDIQRQLNAADYTYIEHGVVDTGITGGGGKFGWETLMNFIDRRNAAGHAVILDGNTTDPTWRLYSLASYFLINNGNDGFGNDSADLPNNFWGGLNTHLGAALNARYVDQNVWRRDFANGIVLVNEPGKRARTVTVPAGYADLTGASVTSVTLGAAQGAVLVKVAAPAPAPTATPASTHTTVDTTSVATPTPTPTPTPAPAGTATPTPSSTPAPTSPTPTPEPLRSRSGRVNVARVKAHTAGANAPATTRTIATASSIRVHGRVKGASAGAVKITVDERHGSRWASVRRAKANVSRGGSYSSDVARLPRGSYRVRASYLGTGTAKPSRSPYHRFTLR